MPEFEKKTAYKVAIGELLKGTFVRREGWEPSYIKGIDGIEISRVNLIALAVALENTSTDTPSLILDDGTGKIEARSFPGGTRFPDIEVGNLVTVIGRPRAYNNQIYIAPEIIRNIDNQSWAEVRKKELSRESIVLHETSTQPAPTHSEEPEEIEIPPEHPSQKVYSLIKELDTGTGAPIDEVIKKAGDPNTEKIISTLLMEGDIFEVKNGRLKVLE